LLALCGVRDQCWKPNTFNVNSQKLTNLMMTLPDTKGYCHVHGGAWTQDVWITCHTPLQIKPPILTIFQIDPTHPFNKINDVQSNVITIHNPTNISLTKQCIATPPIWNVNKNVINTTVIKGFKKSITSTNRLRRSQAYDAALRWWTPNPWHYQTSSIWLDWTWFRFLRNLKHRKYRVSILNSSKQNV